jgi:hypothetical protein
MKKPRKTLKDLERLEKLLSKQTSRSAKLLARRKGAETQDPVTAGYYDRIAAHHAATLADLSEIVHLTETLSRQIVEADAAKSTKKAAVRKAPTKASAAKASAPKELAVKSAPNGKATTKRRAPAKVAVVR